MTFYVRFFLFVFVYFKYETVYSGPSRPLPKHAKIAVHTYCRYISPPPTRPHPQRRRNIKTEEKAKVVAAAWRAELSQFFATLAIFHQDDFKNRINCTRPKMKDRINAFLSSYHPGAK